MFISQQLLVESPVQRSIVIGKKGAVIDVITQAAEKEISEVLGRPVNLSLSVRVG